MYAIASSFAKSLPQRSTVWLVARVGICFGLHSTFWTKLFLSNWLYHFYYFSCLKSTRWEFNSQLFPKSTNLINTLSILACPNCHLFHIYIYRPSAFHVVSSEKKLVLSVKIKERVQA